MNDLTESGVAMLWDIYVGPSVYIGVPVWPLIKKNPRSATAWSTDKMFDTTLISAQ